MGSLRPAAIVLLAFLPTATALAEECPQASSEHRLEQTATAVHQAWWQTLFGVGLQVLDDVAMAGAVVVGGAVLLGLSPAWLPILAAALAVYGLVRWVPVMVLRGIHHQSLNPFTNADARRAWLSLIACFGGVGQAFALFNGLRGLAVASTVVSAAAGMGGSAVGILEVLGLWRRIAPGARWDDLARALFGLPFQLGNPPRRPR